MPLLGGHAPSLAPVSPKFPVLSLQVQGGLAETGLQETASATTHLLEAPVHRPRGIPPAVPGLWRWGRRRGRSLRRQRAFEAAFGAVVSGGREPFPGGGVQRRRRPKFGSAAWAVRRSRKSDFGGRMSSRRAFRHAENVAIGRAESTPGDRLRGHTCGTIAAGGRDGAPTFGA